MGRFDLAFGAYTRLERVQPSTVDPTQDTKVALVGITGMAFKTSKTGGRWTLEASRSDQNGLTNQQLTADFVIAF